jgi:hypothetical protein
MSDYMFGVTRKRLTQRQIAQCDRICKEQGAKDFVYIGTTPGTDVRGWFTCENLGEPFNGAIARAVRLALEAEGLEL